MAKFCTKCGKKLEEGKACDCQTVASNTQPVTTTTSSNTFDVNEIVNSYIEIVKGIFVKPIDTIKKFATSSNFILGLIALALNCIISGIFTYCVASECVGLINSFMGFGSYSSLMGLGTASIEIPFMKTFFYGFLFMAVEFAVTAIMIYVMAGLVFKTKVDIKKMFALVGVCSVFTTITTIVAIVLTYISMKAMLVVVLIASMFYLVYLYHGIGETTEVNKNKLAYVFVPAMCVASFVVGYILPKILF